MSSSRSEPEDLSAKRDSPLELLSFFYASRAKIFHPRRLVGANEPSRLDRRTLSVPIGRRDSDVRSEFATVTSPHALKPFCKSGCSNVPPSCRFMPIIRQPRRNWLQ